MKLLAGILAVLLLAGPAFSIDTPEDTFKSSVASLLSAVADKIDDLSAQDLDKVEKKILKALTKAEKIGIAITVEIDKKALKKLGKMMKSVEKALKASESSITSIETALDGLKSALDLVVDDIEAEAEAEKEKLQEEKNAGKIEKKIDKAFTKLSGIDSLWSERFSKAWATYVKSILGYEKAILTASKLYDKELSKAGVLDGFKFDSDGKLINTSGGNVNLLDLIYDLKISVPGAPAQSFKFKLSDEAPNGTLPIAMGAGTFDPGTYNFGAIAQVWNLVGGFGIKVSGKIVYVTSAGNMTYKFN